TGVMIGGKPAARMGDSCAHGGVIMGGCPTVLIGEAGGGGGGGIALMPVKVMLDVMHSMPVYVQKEISQIISAKNAAEYGQALMHNVATCPICSKQYNK
ncbi:MAG: hypothetical protein ABI378_06965, partial [Chitinophagaceae bacterium]